MMRIPVGWNWTFEKGTASCPIPSGGAPLIAVPGVKL
jgi:hypothetical protein